MNTLLVIQDFTVGLWLCKLIIDSKRGGSKGGQKMSVMLCRKDDAIFLILKMLV